MAKKHTKHLTKLKKKFSRAKKPIIKTIIAKPKKSYYVPVLIDHRISYNKTKEQIFEKRVNVTVKTLTTALLEQERLGNLNEAGKALLRNPKNIRMLVENSYINHPGSTYTDNNGDIKTYGRTKELTEFYTHTGKLAKEVTNVKGETTINYGRDVKNLYRDIKKQYPGASDFEATAQLFVNGGQSAQRKTLTYKYKLNDYESFVKSLQGSGSLIALRINLGENRKEVLEDYGY